MWPDSDMSTFAYLENRYPEEIILLGHSHVQFQHPGSRASFVKPGAVGQQRLGQPLACYAVLRDGYIDLRTVEYDSGKTAADMERIGFEDREFIEEWKRGYLDGVLPSRYKMRDLSPFRQLGYR